jgi:hypothetical protein
MGMRRGWRGSRWCVRLKAGCEEGVWCCVKLRRGTGEMDRT